MNSSLAYHLLDDGVEMQPSDEALSHDCLSWRRLDADESGHALIGRPYSRFAFVPIRRAGARETPGARLMVEPERSPSSS